jgi:hypothetical protein
LFPGGIDSPTFHQRRKVVLTAYVELESVELYRENLEAAKGLGSQLGVLLHNALTRGKVV